MPDALSPTPVDIVADLDAIGPLLLDLLTGAMRPGPRMRAAAPRSSTRSASGGGIDFTNTSGPRSCAGSSAESPRSDAETPAPGLHPLPPVAPGRVSAPVSSFLIKVTEFMRDPTCSRTSARRDPPELIPTPGAESKSCGSGRPAARPARRPTRWRSSSPMPSAKTRVVQRPDLRHRRRRRRDRLRPPRPATRRPPWPTFRRPRRAALRHGRRPLPDQQAAPRR